MVKIKAKHSLKEYGDIIRKLHPVLTDTFVGEVQDYIEHQVVIYSPKDIEKENFLSFVAEKWPSELKVEELESNPFYIFSLYEDNKAVIEVTLTLGSNEEETEIMVSDIDIELNGK